MGNLCWIKKDIVVICQASLWSFRRPYVRSYCSLFLFTFSWSQTNFTGLRKTTGGKHTSRELCWHVWVSTPLCKQAPPGLQQCLWLRHSPLNQLGSRTHCHLGDSSVPIVRGGVYDRLLSPRWVHEVIPVRSALKPVCKPPSAYTWYVYPHGNCRLRGDL